MVKRNAQDLGPGEVICSGPDFVYVGRNQIFLAGKFVLKIVL